MGSNNFCWRIQNFMHRCLHHIFIESYTQHRSYIPGRRTAQNDLGTTKWWGCHIGAFKTIKPYSNIIFLLFLEKTSNKVLAGNLNLGLCYLISTVIRSAGSPLIVRFLGPRKNHTNGNLYFRGVFMI